MPQVALGSKRFRLICGWLPLKNASIVSRCIFMQQNGAISAITLHLSLETAKNSSLVIQHRLLCIIYLSVTLLQLCLCKINLNKHSCKTKFFEVTTCLEILLLLHTCMKFCIFRTLHQLSYKLSVLCELGKVCDSFVLFSFPI